MGNSFLTPPLPAKRPLTSPLAHSPHPRLSMSDPSPNPNPNPSPTVTATANESSKRSKPPLPPIPVSPGHVAFRLLCHASRVGGVIGKSGSAIKQLQLSTGAKIRVEDAPAESADRVITVVAPSAVSSRLSLIDGGGGEEVQGEADVSKAQEALVRVFERILAVAAETDGVSAGVGMVSCRVLVGKSQAGSVIGKGGKVVEKIRKESGCKIRVLTDKLPSCATAGEEMIEVR